MVSLWYLSCVSQPKYNGQEIWKLHNIPSYITLVNELHFLKTPNENFFLFESADSQEILLIIDSFDNNKSSGPNSIPTDVLKLIKNNMSPFKRNH